MTTPRVAPGRRAPPRDRFVDLVRVFSMLAVVVLHWLSVMPYWRGGHLEDRNVVEVVPALWPITWAGDVMALFFFVGGYANWVSYAAARSQGETVGTYLSRRYRRLLRPTLVFFGAWLAVDLVMRLAGRPDLSPLRHVGIGNTIPFGPLWFLGVYLVVIALSPWTMAAHRRWGAVVPVVLAVSVLGTDLAAFALDAPSPLVANLVLVWLVPHQIGYFYADGSLRRLSQGTLLAVAAGTLLALFALTNLPAYPRCLLCARWTVLTVDAPNFSLVLDGLLLIAVALLLRKPLGRWLADPGRWAVVSRLNDLTMPVFLWHMTAYLLAAVALGGLGLVWGTRATAAWWWARPVMALGAGVGLVALLVVVSVAQRVTGGGRGRSAG